ncbi:unnamed protein product [Rhizoctonia solani]|uniref:Transmembrane protein, putative n=1 Tax=Rhizoctonia solani AG-3 Rhs1AP TaxID=1086054 RepID=X8IYF2_9AGAM|nr:transmembrane protein, putative [Rhizoctonia solani AG-3 Rhs1AP]CAE6498907.1 unnamed protein product [Rhizoctonia solani]
MIIKDQSAAGWNYYETSTDDGASSSRMSHLQHELDDSQRPPSPPHQIHTIHVPPSDSPTRRRLGLTAFASTLFVVAMSAGLATFFLLFIILSQVSNVSDPAAFVVRERVLSSNNLESSSLSALAVSTAISHFLSITTPIVLSLLAYRTAYLWMQAQSSPSADEEGVSRLPTPLHYGLLVRILNSSTILNLGPLAAYFLPRFRRRPSAGNTTAIPTPRLLREAFATAFFVYVLAHAIGLADIWLHSVSSVGIVNSVTPADKLPNFSMVFNQTLCDPSEGLQCMNYQSRWGDDRVVKTGALVAANSTNPTEISVITLADANDTAILTPSNFVREWKFSASTYGARSQCYRISKLCAETGCNPDFVTGPAGKVGMSLADLRFPKTSAKVSIRGPKFGDNRDLSRIMAYVGNVTVGSPTGIPASLTTTIPPNPGPVLIKLRWTDFESSGVFSLAPESSNGMIEVDTDPGSAGDAEFQSRTISVMYAQCELEFVKVRYGYSEQDRFVAYDVQGMGGDSAQMAAVLWSPLIWQQSTDQLVNNIHQACLTESTEEGTLAILEQELSRLAIGGAAGLFIRTSQFVSDASKVTQILVGRYPRTPVYVFIGLLYGYAAVTVILFLSTAACTSDVIAFRPDSDDLNKERIDRVDTKSPRTYTALQLAQRRLVDPATLIAEQYVWAPHSSPSQASEMATRLRTADMFGVNQPSKTSTVPERLYVGLGGPYADTGDPRFGVWRRPKRQIDAESDRATYVPGPSPISTDVGLMEGTTLVGSTLHHEQIGMPPAYATLSRGARSRSDGSEYVPEYANRHGSGLVDTRTRVEGRRVDLNVGARRLPPEKDWSGLARVPSNVSSEGSEASTSTIRTARRNTGI